jgi:pyruvate/2-oxoglutarate dehydrogenase complex dihydrolipoamide dehydrogenase (E3) component
MMPVSFDVIVIGAGPAGETAAGRLSAAGMRTALVERELIGGECAYWACIPSKTLLRAAEVAKQSRRTAGTDAPAQHWEAISTYRDYMIRELDDRDEIESYGKRGVRVVKGQASFVDRGMIRVGDEVLKGARIVVATGSETSVPEIPGLREAGFWTNREVTTAREIPDSVCVFGGGPVGIELAQLLARFGATVHLVEEAGRLLVREDERVSELVADALAADGIEVHLGAQAAAVSRAGERRAVRLGDGELEVERVLVATSRKPRIEALALENAGLEPRSGRIAVDDRCRAGAGIWAIGDVTGAMPFSHVAKYQGRIACADILGEQARADYAAIPRAVFCDPEVAAVGLTEAEAREEGLDVAVARVELRNSIARPWTYETEPRGELAVIADRRRGRLVGAWAAGPNASEWIHHAVLAVKAQVRLDVLNDTVAQFPTYCEAYLQALEQLELT